MDIPHLAIQSTTWSATTRQAWGRGPKPYIHQCQVTGWPVLLIITGIDAPISTLIKYRVAKPIFNYCRHQDSNTGPQRSWCVVLPTTLRCPCEVWGCLCIYTTNRFELICAGRAWTFSGRAWTFYNSKTTEKECILLILKMKLLKIWISWRWKNLYITSQKLKIKWSNWKVAILKIKWSKREKKVYVVYTQNEALKKIFKMIHYKGIFHWEKIKLCPGLAHCCLI